MSWHDPDRSQEPAADTAIRTELRALLADKSSWEEVVFERPELAPISYVEAAAARVPIIVPAGETWFGRQTLAALSE